MFLNLFFTTIMMTVAKELARKNWNKITDFYIVAWLLNTKKIQLHNIYIKQIKLIIIIKNLGRLIIATKYNIKLSFFKKHIVACIRFDDYTLPTDSCTKRNTYLSTVRVWLSKRQSYIIIVDACIWEECRKKSPRDCGSENGAWGTRALCFLCSENLLFWLPLC